MVDYLKKCSYNIVEKREEVILLSCMCVIREFIKEGRLFRLVLKFVF